MDNLGNYTIAQVADAAGVHAETVRRWLRAGKLPDTQIKLPGGVRVFSQAEMARVVDYAQSVYYGSPNI